MNIADYDGLLASALNRKLVNHRYPELASASLVQVHPHLYHYAAGGFAMIVKMMSSAGSHFALRLPLRPFEASLKERLSELAAHIASDESSSRWFVECAYLENAVLVKGAYIDAIRMDWVEGQALDQVVLNLCRIGDVKSLRKLADDWLALVVSLRASGIVHGDLQHGNVLVSPQGGIVLVDYDTVCVPSFSRQSSNILGTPGYAHPDHLKGVQRIGELWEVDVVPSLVIHMALCAYSVDPTIIHMKSEENLFVDAQDLENPEASVRLRRLALLCPELEGMVKRLVNCLSSPQGVREADFFRASRARTKRFYTPKPIDVPICPPSVVR